MTKPALPVVAALAALVVSACSEAPEQALANRWPMLTQYCTDCHNDNDLAGGMSLQHVTTADVAANPKRWEEVVRRLRDMSPLYEMVKEGIDLSKMQWVAH